MKYNAACRKYELVAFFVLCFLLTGVIGCDKLNFFQNPKPSKELSNEPVISYTVTGTVIAKVNNMPITLEDLNQEIEAYNSMIPNDKPEMKINTREKKIDYLKNELIKRTLLYQAALDRGLDRKEDIIKAIEKTKMDLLVVELIKTEAEKVNISAKEIEDYYNTYKEQLKEPVQRRIREIVLPSEQEAKDVLIQLLQGTDFSTLARERSISKSAAKGGDLGFVAAGDISGDMDKVAETLEVGQISGVFKTADGYCIIKVEAKQGGKLRSLNEMWDDIKRGLTFLEQQKRIEKLIGDLSGNTKIEVYESEIK
ncbi:MAG: peptidylprolyl isomerase [Candidatus Omnitrophota bacterium]